MACLFQGSWEDFTMDIPLPQSLHFQLTANRKGQSKHGRFPWIA
jgi:hypothetical protein